MGASAKSRHNQYDKAKGRLLSLKKSTIKSSVKHENSRKQACHPYDHAGTLTVGTLKARQGSAISIIHLK